MSSRTIRNFMMKNSVGVDIKISNSCLVMDGRIFKGAYKKSCCQYIFGAECDRYANYLKNILSMFLDSNITCFVIFNGAMNRDIVGKKVIHQKVINRSEGVVPGREDNEFIEPIFILDVIKEVLNELGIQHFTCEYGSKEALFSVAKKFQCPILTNSFYCLYGVSCISYNSTSFNKSTKDITCKIFDYDKAKLYFPTSYDQLAMLTTIMNEEDPFYEKLPELFSFNNTYRLLHLVLQFIRSESKDNAIYILTKKLNDGDKNDLINKISENRHLFFQYRDTLATQYFTGSSSSGRNIQDFEDLVSKSIIPVPYINLKYYGIFSGTWTITDRNKDDAMIPAIDVVFYALKKISKESDLKIKFVGRQNDSSAVWEIQSKIKINPAKGPSTKTEESSFDTFITEECTGFDFVQVQTLPESIWMIIAALIYYINKTKHDVTVEAYSIILSYVMLGPVSEKVGLIKRSNFSLTQNVFEEDNSGELKYKDCVLVANHLLDMFYVNENSLTDDFDREILHNLAEFQHCLQHINYFNKLCGEKIKSTIYYKSLNMTFIYNLILCLKDDQSPLSLIEKLLNCPGIFSYYKKIVEVFNECRHEIVQ